MDYDVTHAATAVRGTVGHIAPDYLSTGKCSEKADVFGYGIFLLELITGQRAFDLDRSHKHEDVLLLDWVRRTHKERKWEMMVDADCTSNYMEDVVEQLVQISLLCTQSNPKKRPQMSEVVRMLEVGDGLSEKLDECYEKEDEQERYSLDTITVGRVLRERGRATNFVTSPSVSQVGNHASSRPTTRKLFSAWHRRRKSEEEFMVNIPEHLRIHLGRLRRFSVHELQVATENFSNKNVFQHAYNKVYKGWLADGSAVVVKGHKDTGNFLTAQDWFQKEVEINSIATHPNVLHVLGFCITKKEWLLVYPLMVNESVASWLRERPEALPPLNWPIRKRIALGAARALAHLHYECDKKIIYRNIKAANILLDEDFEAVVANFENAETVDCNDTHATTAVVGTIGYIAPEYLASGVWSVKTDVYGYGIFLLELITGQGPFDLAQLANDCGRLLQDLHHVKKLLREGRWRIIIDQDCKNEVDVVTVQLMVLAILCTQSNPEERPTMPDVVSMLELEDVLELEDGMPREWHGVQIQWSEQEISLPEDEYIPDEIFDSPR